MATTATESQGKTSFVKAFLHDNPQAKAKAVNEAWQAAGMKGTISHPVISQVRKQLGLIGNLRGNSKMAAKEKADSNMPGTATVTPGKTSFVKDFLNANPQGKTKDVNEAWQAAGFDGTISPTLVNKTRVKLTGNLGGNSKTAAKGKSAPRMPKTVTATPGKTSFLKEFLHDNPQGNVKAVNEAWQAAGFDGTISTALVYKARASLGLTGNLSGKTKTSAEGKATPTGKKLGRPRKEPTAAGNGQPRGRKNARTLALTELEADIDLLIFKVMGVGDLTEIEAALRQARRLLYVTANER